MAGWAVLCVTGKCDWDHLRRSLRFVARKPASYAWRTAEGGCPHIFLLNTDRCASGLLMRSDGLIESAS